MMGSRPSVMVRRTGFLSPPRIFARAAPISKSGHTGSPSTAEGIGGPEPASGSRARIPARAGTRITRARSLPVAPASRDLGLAELQDPVEVRLGDRHDTEARALEQGDVGEIGIGADRIEGDWRLQRGDGLD